MQLGSMDVPSGSLVFGHLQIQYVSDIYKKHINLIHLIFHKLPDPNTEGPGSKIFQLTRKKKGDRNTCCSSDLRVGGLEE